MVSVAVITRYYVIEYSFINPPALIHETVIRMIESAKTPTISVPVSDDSPTMMQEPPPGNCKG